MIKKRLKKGLILLPATLALMAGASSIHAASTTQNMAVTATVAASCTFTVTSLAFGSYTLAQLDGISNISLTCTNGTAYTIALGAGTGPSASTSARQMTGPTVGSTVQYLNYALYNDSGRSTNWGATSSSGAVTGTGTGAAVTIPVYGRIPAGQTASIGSYADTIVVTVSY